MSLLLRASLSAIAPRFVAASPALAKPFTAGSVRLLKETAHDSPDLGSEYEKHKEDQLKKQKEGRGHWKPELASNSEESVAADRHEHNDHSGEGFKELQKKTASHAEEKHKTGTSQSSGLD